MSDMFKKTKVQIEVEAYPFTFRIRGYREKIGKTQEQMASIIGCGRTVYTNWELGTCLPSISYVPGLCKALEIDPNELFCWPEQKDNG